MKPLKSFVFTFLVLFVANLGFAQGNEALSPFSSRKSSPAVASNSGPPAPSPLDTFEFNGMMKMGGVVSVSVYDTKTNRNYWLKEGESLEGGLKLARYDAANNVAVLSKGGVSKRLSLKKAQIEPLKIANQKG